MLFRSLPQICDADVSIRPIDQPDLPAWAALVRLPEILDYTSWNLQSEEELLPYVFRHGEESADGPIRFAIFLKASDQLVGTIGFHNINLADASAELGYELHPSVWGRGIATRLCAALVKWAHESAQLMTIQAAALVTNERSIRVLERCSFRREALLRNHRKVRGILCDYYVYAHVRDGASTHATAPQVSIAGAGTGSAHRG